MVKCDCKSKFVNYLTTCRKCAGQYVGRTTNGLAIRYSTHKQRIKQGQEGIDEHYHVCGLDNFSFQVIDQVHDGGGRAEVGQVREDRYVSTS